MPSVSSIIITNHHELGEIFLSDDWNGRLCEKLQEIKIYCKLISRGWEISKAAHEKRTKTRCA